MSKGIWPAKDPDFIAWLHRLPCAACVFEQFAVGFGLDGFIESCRAALRALQWSTPTVGIEAAHVGDRGLSQTCSDREAIPLCKAHHDRGSAIGHHVLGKRFWTVYGIVKAEIVAALNALYEENKHSAG